MEEETAFDGPAGSKHQRASEALLVVTTVLWGTTFTITKTLTEIMPPFFYMALRFLIAALGFLPFIMKFKKFNLYQLKVSILAGAGAHQRCAPDRSLPAVGSPQA